MVDNFTKKTKTKVVKGGELKLDMLMNVEHIHVLHLNNTK